jgi:hypothetical protein
MDQGKPVKVSNDWHWTGLAHWDKERRYIDHFSTPDGWQIGFEVVYRLMFSTKDGRVLDEFERAFADSFGLSSQHYDLPKGGTTAYWRIYWDREAFDLELLRHCEKRLNEVGERVHERVLVLELGIVPRSKAWIAQLVKSNNCGMPNVQDYRDNSVSR